MLTSLDVAIHWPLVLDHLPLDRQLSLSRGLETLAEGIVESHGQPVAMSNARLIDLGVTRGEGGRMRENLRLAERARVVVRPYRGGGTRPDLWTFQPDLARWRLGYRVSARYVATAIAGCVDCRARMSTVARLPGGGLAESREVEEFHLAPSHHLGKWRSRAIEVPEPRAALVHRTPPDQGLSNDGARPGARESGSYTSPSVEGNPYPYGDGEGEALRSLKTLIRRETGQAVFPASAPERQLRAALALVGPEGVGSLVTELALEIRGLRSAPVAADRALALAPGLAADQHKRATEGRVTDERRLARLEWEIAEGGAGDEPAVLEEARVLRERIGSLGTDA
jgi:hypothetical protein